MSDQSHINAEKVTKTFRQPTGHKSSFSVERNPAGGVDFHFMRSTQGELLCRFTETQAREFADALARVLHQFDSSRVDTASERE